VISDRPFIVDRWYLWSDGELRKQRFRYPTQEDAEHACMSYLEMGDTTRIRLSKDSRYSNKPTVIKVWEKGM
jgi:hypothetical protein